jgi:hypothetical protein
VHDDTISIPTDLSACSRRQICLYLRIQILSNFQSFGVSVRGEKARHPIVRKVNSVWALVDENRYRRVRTGIWHVLNHLAHDDGVAYDEA